MLLTVEEPPTQDNVLARRSSLPVSSVLRDVRRALNPLNASRFFLNEAVLRPALLFACVAVISSYVFTGWGTALGRNTNPYHLKPLAIVTRDLDAARIHEGNTRCVVKKNTIVETVAQSGSSLICVPINSPETGVTLVVPREAASALSPVGLAVARLDVTVRHLPNPTAPEAQDLPAGKRLLLLARKADWLLVGQIDAKTGPTPLGWVQAALLEPLSLTIVSAGSAYEDPSRARPVGKVAPGEEYRGYGRAQGTGGTYLLVEREREFAWIPESLAAYSGR